MIFNQYSIGVAIFILIASVAVCTLFFFAIHYLIKRLTQIKCKYWKNCKYYDISSRTCNRDGGMYYGWDRPAGCYRQNAEKEAN